VPAEGEHVLHALFVEVDVGGVRDCTVGDELARRHQQQLAGLLHELVVTAHPVNTPNEMLVGLAFLQEVRAKGRSHGRLRKPHLLHRS